MKDFSIEEFLLTKNKFRTRLLYRSIILVIELFPLFSRLIQVCISLPTSRNTSLKVRSTFKMLLRDLKAKMEHSLS